MEFKCPECGQQMAAEADGKTVTCPTHGAYEIQYEAPAAAPPVIGETAAPPPMAGSAQMCANHTHVAASFVCRDCGKFICSMCSRTQPNGTWLCQSCADKLPGALPPPINLMGKKCVQHATVAATRSCKICAAPMCPVCDFVLPGNVHLCPKCVIAPQRPMSGGRKKLLISAYVLASWNTLSLMLLMSGLFSGFSKSEAALVGLFFSLFIFIPSIIGTALGVSTIDKRLANPPAVWGAAIWNSIIMSFLLLRVVLANFK